MASDRFDRFLPFAGVLAGLLLAAGLTLTYSIPNSETAFDETLSWWQDNRGQHQISGLLLAPLVALMLVFFGAGLKRSLRQDSRDSGHGSVAFGGAILGATGFALIGMLEGAATNAAHEAIGRPSTRSASSILTTGWRSTPPGQPCSSQPVSARAAIECCHPRSYGRRSSLEHHS